VPTYLWRLLGCASAFVVSVCYSLSLAAGGRGSDTYKRLALGLAHYCAFATLLLQSVPSHAIAVWPLPALPYAPGFSVPLGAVISVVCLVSSFVAYTDLLRGKPDKSGIAFFSWGGSLIPGNIASLGFRVLTIAAVFAGVTLTFYAGGLEFGRALPLQMLGTFSFSTLAASALVLADAAERSRLAASTFRRLNAALALSSAVAAFIFSYEAVREGCSSWWWGTVILLAVSSWGAYWSRNARKQ